MKTVSGQIISTKEVTLSKAAKILSKFVSAENGSSQAISAYLHRASTAFNELNQLHKELKLSSSNRNHKSHRTENANQDNEKSSRTVFKSSQEPNLNASIGFHVGNEGGSEKRKSKKKRQEVDYRDHGDLRIESGHGEGEVKVPTETQNAIELSEVHGCDGEDYAGMEERKKQKKEKRKKKNEKEGASKFSSSKSEVENLEVETAMGSRHQKEIEKDLGNNMDVENGGLDDPQETQIKKKTKNGLLDEEAKMEHKKKRKNENEEDRTGYVSIKRQKRKHDGDQ